MGDGEGGEVGEADFFDTLIARAVAVGGGMGENNKRQRPRQAHVHTRTTNLPTTREVK